MTHHWLTNQLSQRVRLLAVKSYLIDRQFLLGEICAWSQIQSLPVYFWNPGYTSLQSLNCSSSKCSEIPDSKQILDFCLNWESAGIFVLEGLLNPIDPSFNFQLRNTYFYLQQHPLEKYFLLVDDCPQIPMELYPILPLVEQTSPSPLEVATLLEQLLGRTPGANLIRACLGLPRGEISLLVGSSAASDKELLAQREFSSGSLSPHKGMFLTNDQETDAATQLRDSRFNHVPIIWLLLREIDCIAGILFLRESLTCLSATSYDQQKYEAIMDYKQRKLAGRGLAILPDPDVPDVGGLDLLQKDWDKIKKLFDPEARERGLSPPKGCLLWGLPGTGKSLIAKMAAKKIGATLVSCDWNQLLGGTVAQSLDNLQYVLNLVDGMGACILFFDEFEKAFAGWDSGTSSGVLAKMAGKLLTWMQDHSTPVIMLATINHLDMLPPELVRRFEYIWFFNSSLHNGAMWEVFQLHLEKHFPKVKERFTDDQWRKLFIEYRGCSPAEIGGAVKRTHDTLYYRGFPREVEPEILWKALLEERNNFKPALANPSISNQLAKILLEADFARPVRGSDRSRFATPVRKLFEPPRELPGLDIVVRETSVRF